MRLSDLTQLERHRREQRLRQCNFIDCITEFESEFEKSFMFRGVSVEFTRSLHCFAELKRFLVNVRACGLLLVSDEFIQHAKWIKMLVMNLR